MALLPPRSFRSDPEYSRTAAGRPRIESLTGLRWFAALAVFFSHYPLPGVPKWLATIFANGYMGVTVFFVLSGFILTVTYHGSLQRPSLTAIWNFGVARLARVYPTYLLVLGYVMLLRRKDGESLHGWLAHVLAVQAWSSNVRTAFGFNGPGWSVGVEFFLYACFPLLAFLLGSRIASSRLDSALVAAAVVAAMSFGIAFVHYKGLDALAYTNPSSAHRWLFRTPATRSGDFVLGMCTAYIFLHPHHKAPRARLAIGCQVGLVLVIVGLMSRGAIYFSAGSWDVVYAVPTALLIWFLAAAPNVGVARFLSIPPVVALGEASYAFYLIHGPLKDELGARIPGGGTLDNFFLDCLQLGLVAGLAWGIHVAFERPTRRWLRAAFSLRPVVAAQPAHDAATALGQA